MGHGLDRGAANYKKFLFCCNEVLGRGSLENAYCGVAVYFLEVAQNRAHCIEYMGQGDSGGEE